MDASPRKIVDLITGAGSRFVVPVFQRPYSWDEENCKQLWDDILITGRGGGSPHFTGSVVWIQDGTMSATGITKVLLIDGQQRITTITLLLIALARYAKEHPEQQLAFSFDEIMGAGYLVNPFKTGDDHYKLTLSKGDRDTLHSLIENLKNPDVSIIEDSSRLLDNLGFFEARVSAIEDPNVVWAGIQRLEIVSISLTQGQDNPQLIFESMNSTGKDLSSADLIRNFVLMGQPDQDNLYLTYWRPIEETLGASTYDDVFDEFVRDWLTVIYAPEPLAKRDVYQTFKRHYETSGYGRTVPVENLLKELQRFAGYYAAITAGKSDKPEVKHYLDRIARLDISVANPLLMSLLDDCAHNAFGEEDTEIENLVSMLAFLESYLFRRVVCDCASNSLQKFFSSLIGRLNRIQDEGGNYVEAFTAMLLNEEGSARRFPKDSEFANDLRTRDTYNFRRSFFLLSCLENSFHPKDERNFSSGQYTIEHIMPQNALAHEEWREMIGDVTEEEFEHLVHNIGNLTLTAYNSELSDGTFQEKKDRAVGGYDVEYLSISSELKDATKWTNEAISNRAERLIEAALALWPYPEMDADTRKIYQPERKVSGQTRQVTFKDLFNTGAIKAGDKLICAHPNFSGEATVTDEGAIRLASGEEFSSPSPAILRLVASQGSSLTAANGWYYWRLNSDDGPRISELKNQVDAREYADNLSERKRFRVSFWDGLYDWLSESPSFTEAFNDPSNRKDNPDYWADFGIGLSNCHISLHVLRRDGLAQAGLYYPSGSGFEKLAARKEYIEDSFSDGTTNCVWYDGEEGRKFRALYLRRSFDYDNQDWGELYEWMEHMALRLRALALEIYG